MKKKKLYNKTYNKTIIVIYGCDNKSFCKFIKRNYKEDIDIENAKGCFYDKHSKMIIWTGEKKQLDMNTFVHELCHACFYLLRYVSIPARKENDESFAYLFESFYSQIK